LSQELQVVFVVLADLHFGAGLREEAEVPPLNTPNSIIERALRLFNIDVGSAVERFVEHRCVAHDIETVRALPRYLKQVLRQLRADGYKGNEFDFYVLLGDLATWPNESSFDFVRSYLTERRIVAGDRDLRVSCAGLGIPRDRLGQKLIVVPGNHDKLLRTSLDFYHQQFLEPLGLARQPQTLGCHLVSRSVGSREFLFILVDPSRYAAKDMNIDVSARDHLAGGEVTATLRNEILRRLAKVKSGEPVDDAQLRDYMAATKILVVHYAVDLSRFPGLKVESLILPHECEDLGRLVGDLGARAELNLVLHGHLHMPKIYNHMGVPVVAASTVTQKRGDNGFFLLKFFSTGEIRAEHHRWFGTGFLPDPSPTLNRTIVVPQAAVAAR